MVSWMKNLSLLTVFIIPAIAGLMGISYATPLDQPSLDKTYALIICGSPEEENRNITRLAYETFLNLGIPKNHITVLAHHRSFRTHGEGDFDGDGEFDIHYPLTDETVIEQALIDLGNVTPEDGQAIIYLSSHGSRNSYDSFVYLFPGYTLSVMPIELTGQKLDEYIDRYFKPDSQKFIMIQACKSGGFIDSLKGPNRLIITSSDHHLSYRGPIEDKSWPKFSYYFLKALQHPSIDTDGDQIVSLSEAFTAACLINHPIHWLHQFFYGLGLWGDDEPQVYFEEDMVIGQK